MHTYILQIETSTSVCSVALVESGRVCQTESLDEPNVHASQLTVIIQSLLKKEQIEFHQLAAIAVSKGPGSYTGLRIGVSTAKGLCYALDIPLIAVNTLDGIYEGFKRDYSHLPLADLYIPMLDARRMEVYSTAFNQAAIKVVETAAEIIDASSFDSYSSLYPSIYIFGPGADKLTDLFANSTQVSVIPDVKTNAIDLSRLVYEKYVAHDFEDLAYFEPYYLKDFVALQSKKKQNS